MANDTERQEKQTDYTSFKELIIMNLYFQGPPVLFVIQQGDGFVQKMALFATFRVI